MENNEKIIKEIKPHFNFIYELFMPTGKKLKGSLILFLVSVALLILLAIFSNQLNGMNSVIWKNITFYDTLKFILIALSCVAIIKFIFHITIQKMQYNGISYKFYESYMVYEDSFLNQHKKNIQYSNIKEVELRRTIWDRLLGMGVVIIYTNAENKRGNGLVVYALNHPKEDYEFIDGYVAKFRDGMLNNKANYNNVDESGKNDEEELKNDEKVESLNEETESTNLNSDSKQDNNQNAESNEIKNEVPSKVDNVDKTEENSEKSNLNNINNANITNNESNPQNQ